MVKDILENQAELGCRNILLVLRRDPQELAINHPAIFFCEENSPWTIRPLKQIVSLVRERKVQVIHAHLLRSQLFAALAKLLCGDTLVVIWHEHGGMNEMPLIRWIMYALFRGAVDCVIAVSNTIAEELKLRTLIKKDRVVALSNPINIASIEKYRSERAQHQDIKNKYCLPLGSFLVGFVGRLEQQKGCEVFLHALHKLDRSYFGVIVGSGIKQNKYQILAHRLDIYDRVKFLGQVNPALTIMSALDALAIPSHFESFGLVAVEAMTLGIPVVASRVGGLSEIVVNGTNGLLFPAGSSDKLAACLRRLKDEVDLRRRLAATGKKTAERFDISPYLSQLKQIYLRSLKE